MGILGASIWLLVALKFRQFYAFLGFRFRGALVGRLMMGILGASIWLPGIVNLLTMFPPPPSKQGFRT